MYVVREFRGSALYEHHFCTKDEVIVFWALLTDFLRNKGIEWQTNEVVGGGFTVEFDRQPFEPARSSNDVRYIYEFRI